LSAEAQWRLRRAAADDIPFIMETERLDGYDQVVGRWDEARHRREMAGAGADCAYFIGLQDVMPFGFIILRGWASPERVTLLKRIAVREPGRGHGSMLLRLAIDEVFRTTDAYRLWLGVFPENLRARRAYGKIGFVAEGIARGSAFFGGVHRDELTMAILRPEWQQVNAGT
jgi:RimJ/RimL family protein N-acetyltransferase